MFANDVRKRSLGRPLLCPCHIYEIHLPMLNGGAKPRKIIVMYGYTVDGDDSVDCSPAVVEKPKENDSFDDQVREG